jgi:hypothetical protein
MDNCSNYPLFLTFILDLSRLELLNQKVRGYQGGLYISQKMYYDLSRKYYALMQEKRRLESAFLHEVEVFNLKLTAYERGLDLSEKIFYDLSRKYYAVMKEKRSLESALSSQDNDFTMFLHKIWDFNSISRLN